MPDHPTPPVELGYSTFSAGTLDWRREGDLLHITVHARQNSSTGWPRVLAVWAAVLVATLVWFSAIYGVGPGAVLAAAVLTGFFILCHIVLVVIDRFAGLSRRHLQIRVSRRKVLVDECGVGIGGDGACVSVRRRAWAADEITAVTAAGGSLRVRTRTRRLAPLSVAGYDPADVAFVAGAIGKVLSGGVDAWVESQRPVPASAPTS